MSLARANALDRTVIESVAPVFLHRIQVLVNSGMALSSDNARYVMRLEVEHSWAS
jgi:hypothetical protein